MDQKVLIATLVKIIADDDQWALRNLLENIGTDYYTEKYFLSKEADDEWEYAQEERDMDDREEWAKDEAQFYLDHGYPNENYYTANPKQVKDGTWLVHFTDSEPNDIVKNGFKGRDFDILGLTTHFTAESNPGEYAFAYTADKVDFEKYGKNAIFFKAKEAVKTYHYGDEEDQVIFVADTAYDLNPVWGNSDELTIEQDDGEDFICDDRDQECVQTLIEKFESK